MFTCRRRQCLPAEDDNVYLQMTTMFTCRWRQCLPADDDNVHLQMTTMFTCRRRQCLPAEDDNIYLQKTTMFTCRRRQCLPAEDDNVYLQKTTMLTCRWRQCLPAEDKIVTCRRRLQCWRRRYPAWQKNTILYVPAEEDDCPSVLHFPDSVNHRLTTLMPKNGESGSFNTGRNFIKEAFSYSTQFFTIISN